MIHIRRHCIVTPVMCQLTYGSLHAHTSNRMAGSAEEAREGCSASKLSNTGVSRLRPQHQQSSNLHKW